MLKRAHLGTAIVQQLTTTAEPVKNTITNTRFAAHGREWMKDAT